MTRLEWSVLRSALGRPRRLSLTFLREERLRLEGYREHARMKYEEVAHGYEVPPDLPRQLRVGQEVTARHPGSGQLYDGVILTVKGNKYRVQFHRSELMTEVIRDTDVMPVDPHECMPPHSAVVPLLLNGRPYDPIRLAELRGLLPPQLKQATGLGRPLGSWTSSLETQLMRDQDAMMVHEVQRALEVKETLVARLTQLNSEAASGQHEADDNGSRTEQFQLQYTNVVLQLKETNAVLDAALSRLQARQQQVVQGSGVATYGAALAALQQQHQAQPIGGLSHMLGVRPGGPLVQVQQLQPPLAQTPPAPQVLSSPAQLPAPSPTVPIPVVPSGHQPGRGKTPGALAPPQVLQPPLIVPPPRGGVAASTGGLSASASPGVSSEQLVGQALAEARAVVDVCRGKTTEPLPQQLLPPGAHAASIPVVAPVIAAPPAGGSVPPGEPQCGAAAVAPQLSESGASDASQAQQPAADGAAAAGHCGLMAVIKAEDGAVPGLSAAAAATASATVRAMAELQALSTEPAATGRPMTEEEVSESWLRDVIVGCVGVLFTIQKCTAGNVPAATVAEALDLAVQQLQIKTGGENQALYTDIVQSVQGLKGYLTRAMA
ncbi:hypothetical protein GPECTOR_22g820 [Gonium pectorale]|uniref:DIRP domain-containing protein n=1 Tax=Gonium pectorale TaxID=33097 RepID=A0A150GHG3_GONPE|nr:hypothetical protein GPECTOR_22g820 [Gonium pectorale]|eukprot:KXZ49229.1 hypothetical protein GPECTOR_22g820 [Gonium pectorale]